MFTSHNRYTRRPLELCCCLLILCAAESISAQFDISNGNAAPTITGHRNGSITGTGSVTTNLNLTVNFGDLSIFNTNSIVKVVVPVAIRGDAPYQVTATVINPVFAASPQAVQRADIGFGVTNIVRLGTRATNCTQSQHTIRAPYNNDPSVTNSISASGRTTYTSSIASLGNGATVILSGPRLTTANSVTRRADNGYSFDLVLAIKPQYYASGNHSFTLRLTIAAGANPNLPC